jgi:hypothetical protein
VVSRKKTPAASITTERTLQEMRYDLLRLVDLLEIARVNRFLGLVSGGQHLES